MGILRESLDFERIESPLEKMRIGKKESDLIFIKEHEWDFSLPHIFRDFTVEELIRNFNDIPILVLKSNAKIYKYPTYVAISTDYHSDHKDTPEEAIAELKLDLFGIEESLKFTREGSNLEKIGIGKTAVIKDILNQLCIERFNAFQNSPTVYKKEIQNIKSIPENLKELNEKNAILLSRNDFLDLYKSDSKYIPYLDEILERIANFNPNKFEYHRTWTEVFWDLNKIDMLFNSPYNWVTDENIHILMDYKEKKTIEKIKELEPNKIFSICSQKNWYPELILYAIDHGATNLNIGSNEAIRKACERGDLLIAERLLKDPSVDPTQNTPDVKRYKQDEANFCIRRAAKNGHLDIVKLLLKDGRSDPSYKNNFALSAAITNKDKPMMDLLLSDKRVKEAVKYMPKTKQDELRLMKLVKESLLSFEKNKDAFSSLNIGMIDKVQRFMENLKNEFPESNWEWKINSDLSVDIFWPEFYKDRNPIFDISIEEYGLLPFYIKFNRIEGDFACSFTSKESLKSFPKFIKGNCEIFGKKTKEFNETDIRSICKIEKDLKIYP